MPVLAQTGVWLAGSKRESGVAGNIPEYPVRVAARLEQSGQPEIELKADLVGAVVVDGGELARRRLHSTPAGDRIEKSLPAERENVFLGIAAGCPRERERVGGVQSPDIVHSASESDLDSPGAHLVAVGVYAQHSVAAG